MVQHSRTTLRTRPSEPSIELLDRLHGQFPELSRHEVLEAVSGVTALPAPEPDLVEPMPPRGVPPRHRA